METQINPAKLFAKIAKVMAKVRTLEKTGENKFDRYNFVTADAVATRLGTVLAENGLAFLPSLVSVETSEYTTQKGGSNFRTVANFQMTLACTETGATWTSLWSGEAIDRSDKSISKAAVSAVKYFLLKTFLLAGGDDEDADATTPTVDNKKPTHNDDAMWEPDIAPRATEEQLARLNELGETYYAAQWQQVKDRNVKRISAGKAVRAGDLTPDQIQKLIDGITGLMNSKATNGAVAK